MSQDTAPGAACIHKVGITITTDDDDTLDALIDYLMAFGEGDLRSVLSTLDPLATVVVDTNEGFVYQCE